MRANEEWRHDDERRAAAGDAYERWTAAIRAAAEHARRAYDELAALGVMRDEDDPLVRQIERIRSDQYAATRALEDVARRHIDPPSDTRVGNMAAFGVGYRRS